MDPATRLEKHLVRALRQLLAGGRPMLPDGGRLVWSFFNDLNATRTYAMAGPNPISYAEIEAWARLHRWHLEARHISAIRAMDEAWLDHMQAKQGRADKSSLPRSSGQAINPAAFDAVFG